MEPSRLDKVLGMMVVFLIGVGIFGVIAAFFAIVVGKDYIGAALCLFVSAYSFNKVLNL